MLDNLTLSNYNSKEIVSIIIPVKNEREHIEKVVKSIYEQSYRPIEVVIVDGGSTDGTLEILYKLKNELESSEFRFKILREEDFGSLRSPGNARNIGYFNSSGEYIIFLDADTIPLDKEFVSKVKEGLDLNPWVAYRFKILLDTTIERALALEPRLLGYNAVVRHSAIRRSILKTRDKPFDPLLGLGEDKDLFDHYIEETLKIKPLAINTYVGGHLPHTLAEFFKEFKWYGKTVIPYYKKHYSLKSMRIWKNIIAPSTPLAPPLLLLLSLFLQNTIMLIFSIILYAYMIYKITCRKRLVVYLKLPKKLKSLRALLMSILLDHVVGPIAWSLGLSISVASFLKNKLIEHLH